MPEVWSIASVVLLDGRIALVATGDAAEAGDPARPGVWWLTQETAGQVGWNGDWQYAGLPAPGLRGGRAAPRIAAAGKGDGGLAAAVCADDAAIWYAWQEKPDNSWSAWYSLATPPVAGTTSPSDPVLVLDGRGRLAVFVTVVGEVWTRRQREQRDLESWTSWAPVGGEVTVLADWSARPAVALLDDGRLEVLATSGSDLRYILETGGDDWAHWRRIACPPALQQPLVALDARNSLVVVVLTAFGHMLRNVQLAPGGDWEGWHGMAPPQPGDFEPLGMALALHADSRPVFLAPYVDGSSREQVWLIEQVRQPVGEWRSRVLGPHPPPELASFARRIEDPVLSVDADGHLVATFRVTGSTNVYWLRQQEVNGDLWLEGVHRAAPPAG
jgi:hypothetical protein